MLKEFSNYQGYEWPERQAARELWQENTKEKGKGVFCFADTDQKYSGSDADVIIAVPIWITLSKAKRLHPTLYKNLKTAYNRRGDAVISVIIDGPHFQVWRVPYDQAEPCTLEFEALQVPKT